MQKGVTMKTVKITKKMLKMHPQDLLVELGAVNLEKKQAYPQHVYFSGVDYKQLRQNLNKSARKQYPWLLKKGLDRAVGMELLNYGPNESLAEAIKPGWALVDEEGIEGEK